MKKIIILFVLLPFLTLAQKQITPPIDAAFKVKLKTDKKLHVKLKKELGYDFSKLIIAKEYKETSFNYTKEGEKRAHIWPKDDASQGYEIHSPKDVNGLYKSCDVYISFRRSVCNQNGCQLTSQWKYYLGSVVHVTQKGFKEFTKSEYHTMIIKHLKNEKIKGNTVPYENYIEIKENGVLTNFAPQFSSNGKSGKMKIQFSGTAVSFTPDRTGILAYHENTETKASCFFSEKSSGWEVDSIVSVYTKYNPSRSDYNYAARQFNEKEVETDFFNTWKEVDFSGVYGNKTHVKKTKGMVEKLATRIDEFYGMVISKGANLTVEDIKPYTKAKEIDIAKYYKKDRSISTPKVLVQYEKIGNAVFERNEIGGGFRSGKVTIVITAKTIIKGLVDPRGGKTSPSSKKAASILKPAKSSIKWVWENGNWYLKDAWGFRLSAY